MTAGAVCPLCACKATMAFTYWKVIPNAFPYDRIAEQHDMIVPLRHVAEGELSLNELAELKEIKETYIDTEYGMIMQGTHRLMSVPNHFHLHLGLNGKM